MPEGTARGTFGGEVKNKNLSQYVIYLMGLLPISHQDVRSNNLTCTNHRTNWNTGKAMARCSVIFRVYMPFAFTFPESEALLYFLLVYR